MSWQQEIAPAIQNCWSDAFNKRDLSRLVGLYTDDATLYGLEAELYRGHRGLMRYFSELSPRYKRAQYGSAVLVPLTPGAVAASGPVVFEVEQDGQLVSQLYRMTHVLVERDGRWLIAAHHASPEPSHAGRGGNSAASETGFYPLLEGA